jgi:hypothetical protein
MLSGSLHSGQQPCARIESRMHLRQKMCPQSVLCMFLIPSRQICVGGGEGG